MRKNPIEHDRIFIGIQEISGYYGNLEAGFIELGVHARFIQTIPHPFNYPQARPNPWPAALCVEAVHRRRRALTPIGKFSSEISYLLAIGILMFWAIPRFDYFIFTWGTSFLPLNIDLLLLRLMRKRTLVVVGHGSEARPPFMSHNPQFDIGRKSSVRALCAQTRKVSARIHRINRFADIVVGLRTTSQFIDGAYVDIFKLGVPGLQLHLAENPAMDSTEIAKRRVLHIPSNSGVKGSAVIEEIFKSLAPEFPHLDFSVVSGVSHDEAIEAIRNSVLVVDQLWSDIPMSMIGIEAASLGVPCIVAGYSWEHWGEFFNSNPELKPFYTMPDGLEAGIRDALNAPEVMKSAGIAAQNFVRANWSPSLVAQRYLRILQGSTDPNWVFEAGDFEYLWGCGVSQDATRAQVGAMIQKCGQESLRWKPRSPSLLNAYASVSDGGDRL